MINRVLITGAAGAVGRVLIENLRASVVAVDKQEPYAGNSAAEWHTGSVEDVSLLTEVVRSDLDAIIHLATGAPEWSSLLSTDMLALKTLGDLAIEKGVPKLIYASSNHVVGMVEREAHASGRIRTYPVDGPPRPDSLYGVAKAYGESLCRFYAESSQLATSCIRIGTVRLEDDLEACAREPYFNYIPGGLPAIRERLERTWLSHSDLTAIIEQELASKDRFRLRFGISGHPEPYWSTDVLIWNPSTT